MRHPLVVPSATVLLCLACSGGSGGTGTVEFPDAGSTGGGADAGSASTCAGVVAGGGAVGVGSADYGGGSGSANVAGGGSLLAKDALLDGPIVWTADGSEVVYIGHPPGSHTYALRATRLRGGTTRQLDVPMPTPSLPIARAADGTALYYVARDDELRDAVSGKSVAPRDSRYTGALATSLNGRLIFYWDPAAMTGGPVANGAAILLDVGRASSIPIASCGSSWFAFSPAADSALCADACTSYDPAAAQRFNLIDVATASVRQRVTTTLSPRALQWDGAILQVAGTRANELVVADLLRGIPRVIYRPPAPSSSTEKTDDFPNGSRMTGITFSADGRKLAFWKAECIGRNSYEPTYCAKAPGELFVLDLHTGALRVIASAEATLDGGGGVGRIAFSDDATRVAYQVRAEIFVGATR